MMTDDNTNNMSRIETASPHDGVEKDYLWLHVKSLPYFRSLLRAVEARFYNEITLPSPTIDIGCGDGHFASVAFDRKMEVGIDPWWEPIREAARWGAYHSLIQSDGEQLPFPNKYFASAVSNSVLEHIPHIDQVLIEIGRVLKAGAPFVFCVPNDRLLPALSISRSLESIGLSSLAAGYRRFFERISRHYNSDPPDVWNERLEKAGFSIDRWWHYFSPEATAVMEWGHYFGLPSLVSRKLTGRWIISPTMWNLGTTYRMIKPYYDEMPIRDDGTYTFYIAIRNP